jgi:adenylate cyclase
MIAVQFALLLVAWTHACIGLYFWLRLKPFFKWAGPILLAIAILLPALAMIGAHHGGREVVELAKQPQWRAQNLTPMPLAQRTVIDEITLFYFPIAYLARSDWCSRRVACVHCANAAAGCSRSPTRTGRSVCRRA